MNNTTNEPSSACTNPSGFDQAMKLVGDFWTLRLIDAIRDDEVRFCQIERRMPDINPATLSGRLKKLEESDIITRHAATIDKQSVTYSLTEQGKGILPILEAIQDFTSLHSAKAASPVAPKD